MRRCGYAGFLLPRLPLLLSFFSTPWPYLRIPNRLQTTGTVLQAANYARATPSLPRECARPRLLDYTPDCEKPSLPEYRAPCSSPKRNDPAFRDKLGRRILTVVCQTIIERTSSVTNIRPDDLSTNHAKHLRAIVF